MFQGGVSRESFCSEMRSNESPQLSPSTRPAPCTPLPSFAALNLSGCSFWQRRTVLLRAEVPNRQRKSQRGGWEKRKKRGCVSQGLLCACCKACHSASPSSGKAELRDGGGASQPALCWLPLPREREIREGNHHAGRDTKASSSSTACLPHTPPPRRRHGCCQQALAPQLR